MERYREHLREINRIWVTGKDVTSIYIEQDVSRAAHDSARNITRHSYRGFIEMKNSPAVGCRPTSISSIRRTRFSVTSTVPQSAVLSLSFPLCPFSPSLSLFLFLSPSIWLSFYSCNSSPRSIQRVLTRPRSLSIGGFRARRLYTRSKVNSICEKRVRRDTPRTGPPNERPALFLDFLGHFLRRL